jgi:ligand-binding SRPBCC domain-containing protein
MTSILLSYAVPHFAYSSSISVPVEKVFAFHERPDALERLTPPWAPVHVLRREGGIMPGGLVELALAVGPFRLRWVARHTAYEQNWLFEDIQETGPFRRWRHRHEFNPENGGARLTDRVEFSLPLAPLSDWLFAWTVRLLLSRLFRYRHETTRNFCLTCL